MRRLVVGAVIAAVAGGPALLAAPSPASAAGSKVFTVGMTADIDSMNPFTGYLTGAYEAWGLMYDTLLGYSQKDFSPVAGLATAWQESPDHLTWTYTIRSGVNWSDGVPLTSADVAYTFNRILKGTYEQTNYGTYTGGIKTVTAPNPTTVVMTIKAPSLIMTRLAVPILPEHIWKNISEKDVSHYTNAPKSGQPIVGSGPFVAIARTPKQVTRFKANPNYWAGAPKVDEVDFRWFGSQEPMVQALKTGDIDIIDGLDAGPYQSLQNVKGVTTLSAQYGDFEEYGFNTGAALVDGTPIGNGNPALKDRAFRRAISHAVDRQGVVDRVLRGRGDVGSSVIPPIYPSLHYDPGATALDYDVAEAGTELDAAGYPKGPNGIRLGKDGKPIKLRLFARSDSATSKQAIALLAGWLKDVGIDSSVQAMSSDSLGEIIGHGNYDVFQWDWTVEPDPNYQLSTFRCSSRSYKDSGSIFAGLSDSFYCNKAYDALYDQQASTTDPAARAVIVLKMEKMLYDDANYIITDYDNDLEAYRSDKWGNLQAQPEPKGNLIFQYGTFTYRNVEPLSEVTSSAPAASPGASGPASTGASAPAAAPSASSSSGGGGSNTGLIIGVIAAVVVLGGGGFLLGRRRGSPGEDDEE